MMRINLNGQDTTVVTTDGYSSNSHISNGCITTMQHISMNGKDGQVLVWKNNHPQWIDMPPAFAQYLAIVEHEQRKTT